MADIFSNYWWLLFPLGFFLAAGWSSYMRYKRTQAKIELLKTYAAAGKEPPADLLASIDADDDDGGEAAQGSGQRSGGGHAFLVVLFAGLGGVFAYAGYTGLIGGVGDEMYFVAMIMGVLALAFFFNGVFSGRRRDR